LLEQPSPITGLDWDGVLVMLLVYVVPAALVGVLSFRSLTHDKLQRVARAWGATGSPTAEDLVRRYLERSRRFRGVGFAIGWASPLVVTIIRGTANSLGPVAINGLAPLGLVMSVVAAIVANEATYRVSSHATIAPLTRRSASRYLNQWQLLGPIAIAVSTILLAIAGVIASTDSLLPTTSAELIVTVVAMIAILTVAMLALHAIVVRRQNLGDPAELTADESTRRFGAMVVSRAAFSAVFSALGAVGWAVSFLGAATVDSYLPTWATMVFGIAGLAGLGYLIAASFANPLDVRVDTPTGAST